MTDINPCLPKNIFHFQRENLRIGIDPLVSSISLYQIGYFQVLRCVGHKPYPVRSLALAVDYRTFTLKCIQYTDVTVRKPEMDICLTSTVYKVRTIVIMPSARILAIVGCSVEWSPLLMKVPEIQKAQPLREQVYGAILSQLRNGHYAPGERVTEGRIAKDLDVSRTPVREAMGQLNRHGILVARDGGGYVVPSPSLDEVKEIFYVRQLVEPCAVKMAAEEYAEDRIAELDKAIAQEVKSVATKNPNAFAVGNENFRSALFDHISNATLKGVISQFGYHLQFMRMTTLKNIEVRQIIVQKQKIIRNAIAAQDGSKAAELWEDYLGFAKISLTSAMEDYLKK